MVVALRFEDVVVALHPRHLSHSRGRRSCCRKLAGRRGTGCSRKTGGGTRRRGKVRGAHCDECRAGLQERSQRGEGDERTIIAGAEHHVHSFATHTGGGRNGLPALWAVSCCCCVEVCTWPVQHSRQIVQIYLSDGSCTDLHVLGPRPTGHE